MTFVVKIRGQSIYLLTYTQVCIGVEGNLALQLSLWVHRRGASVDEDGQN